ncbi:hypothetical protein NDU88_000020 [Pleurodeles waltl]|uniref:Uncharacterized protein n=1 Tax=Pleurodeles waltl TaxID=8319 RepID=A0AAV7WI93_PLEWA|nr:hypothetical protein NDU88_000020 [Pleurodeles waltl]
MPWSPQLSREGRSHGAYRTQNGGRSNRVEQLSAAPSGCIERGASCRRGGWATWPGPPPHHRFEKQRQRGGPAGRADGGVPAESGLPAEAEPAAQ